MFSIRHHTRQLACFGGHEDRYAWNQAKKPAKEYDAHVYTTTQNARRTGTFESNGEERKRGSDELIPSRMHTS